MAFGISFSSKFEINPDWFKKHKVFDPTLDVDTNLFVDPFLLKHSTHKAFARRSFKLYCEHFERIYKLLLVAEPHRERDPAWKAAQKLLSYSESGGMSGTCIGYSKTSTHGRGFGPLLTRQALVTAKRIIDLGVKDPELFSLLSFFEEGIGPDLISDMVINVVWPAIVEFNATTLARLRADSGKTLKCQIFNLRGQAARFLKNPFDERDGPVILLPVDILKHLPIVDDIREVPKVAEANADLRARVNESIQDIWAIRTRKEKEEIRNRVLVSEPAFQTFLDLVKILERKPYDIRLDPDGLIAWRDATKNLSVFHPLQLVIDKQAPEIEQINKICLAIVEQFKRLIEDHRMNRLFFVNGKTRPEKFAQMLFYSTAVSYCDANDLDISPESDGGAGPVDFKFSRGKKKVVVEIKLSTNSKVVSGYTKQIDAYAKAEGAELGHYVLIDVGKLGGKWEDLRRRRDRKPDFKKSRFLHLIDGHLRESASKR